MAQMGRGLVVLLATIPNLQSVQAETKGIAPAFAEFDAWWQQYITVATSERAALVEQGIAAAKNRRKAMLTMIENDPAQAIKLAFAEEYHTALPEPIAKLVEVHVRGLAQLTVSKKKDGVTTRRVSIQGQSWRAYLYDERLKLNTREEIPIHGIALEGLVAIDGSPLERFPNRESLLNVLRQSDGKKTCPICGEPGIIPTAVGDILLWFDTDEHLDTCEKALIEKEMNPEIGE